MTNVEQFKRENLRHNLCTQKKKMNEKQICNT